MYVCRRFNLGRIRKDVDHSRSNVYIEEFPMKTLQFRPRGPSNPVISSLLGGKVGCGPEAVVVHHEGHTTLRVFNQVRPALSGAMSCMLEPCQWPSNPDIHRIECRLLDGC